MSGIRIRHLFLLLSGALLLIAVPVQPTCEMTLHPDAGSCPSGNDVPPGLAGANRCDSAPDEGCCASGCQHCGLPCCVGLAMIKTPAAAIDILPCVLGRLLPLPSRLAWVDPDPFFHPPRV